MIELLGFLVPPLIDLINRKITNSDKRFWVSVVFCFILGIILNFIEMNGVSGYMGKTIGEIIESISKSGMVVFGLAQLSYRAVWDKAEMRNNLDLNAKNNLNH